MLTSKALMHLSLGKQLYSIHFINTAVLEHTGDVLESTASQGFSEVSHSSILCYPQTNS